MKLSETIKNAEAMLEGLDDSYSRVPEVNEEAGEGKVESEDSATEVKEEDSSANTSQGNPTPATASETFVAPNEEYQESSHSPTQYIVPNVIPSIAPNIAPNLIPNQLLYPPEAYGFYPNIEGGIINPYVPYPTYVYYPITPIVPPCYAPVPIPATIPSVQLLPSGQKEDDDEALEKLIDDLEKTLNDQPSCRLVQKRLELDQGTKRQALVNKLFSKAVLKVEEYMNLPFGNYLCQKLFELLTEKQLLAILSRIKPYVASIANNLHGTRSIQKLIEAAMLFPTLIYSLVDILSTHVAELVMVPFLIKTSHNRT